MLYYDRKDLEAAYERWLQEQSEKAGQPVKNSTANLILFLEKIGYNTKDYWAYVIYDLISHLRLTKIGSDDYVKLDDIFNLVLEMQHSDKGEENVG